MSTGARERSTATITHAVTPTGGVIHRDHPHAVISSKGAVRRDRVERSLTRLAPEVFGGGFVTAVLILEGISPLRGLRPLRSR